MKTLFAIAIIVGAVSTVGSAFAQANNYPASGAVGLGTNSPAHRLHVFNSDFTGIAVEGNGGANYIESYFLAKSNNSGRGAGLFLQNVAENTTWYVGVPYNYTGNFMISRKTGTSDLSAADPGYSVLTILPSGNIGVGTSTPTALLDVAGTAKVQGVPINPSIRYDDGTYFSPQAHFEASSFPFPILGGTAPTFAQVNGLDVPFSRVAVSNGHTEFASDFIPVQAGETLYGELWAMRPAGASGNEGYLYYGVAQYDKDKRPIAVNMGLDYFVVGSAVVPRTGAWSRYSASRTLPTSHTSYDGSDGGAVRYVKAYIIVNYPTGSAPTYWGGVVLRRQAPLRDAGAVAFKGNVGIGLDNPGHKLDVFGNSGVTVLGVGDMKSLTKPAVYVWTDADTNLGWLSTRSNHPLVLGTNDAEKMRITTNGNVGIGTSNPSQKLSVNGSIRAKELIVETVGWADYVFGDNYTLKPLSEVERHIQQHKHLPGIPSASEVAEKGVGVGEMQAKLLAKIEELTLHQIRQEKLLREQSDRISQLEKDNSVLRNAR